MSDFTIEIDKRQLEAYLKKNAAKIPNNLDKAVTATTVFGLREVKTKFPKRSGQARRSFVQRKIRRAEREIFSTLAYVKAIEDGARAHTIKPKRAKFLTIPLNKNVRTKTRIKQSALNKLFRELKNRKGRTKKEIFDQVGVALAKKARIPRLVGKKIIQRRVLPRLIRKLNLEVARAIRKTV